MGQSRQKPWPDALWYLPVGQAEQTVGPLFPTFTLNVPGAQDIQTVELVALV